MSLTEFNAEEVIRDIRAEGIEIGREEGAEQKAIEAEQPEEAVPVRKRKTKEEAIADEVKEAEAVPEEKPDVNPAAEAPVRRTRKKREE